eukprot:TRINITY_DN9737_c0_g2_i2.p1 TRINITY_DN9737_c0_g2~~TRINITY_DN9737_c0_g2_i2.p1  ORF type:complete len:118 (-),score=27.29 TRINITY_DN9737_c0_g2_i2:40-393(-)
MINDKHEQIENAFEIMSKLNSKIDVVLTHLRSMRIISGDLQRDVKKIFMKMFLLRRKQRRRNEMLNVLNEIKKLKEGLDTIKDKLNKNDFSSVYDLLQELSIAVDKDKIIVTRSFLE